MSAWCSWCREEFSPVEYAPVPVDPEEVRFCSTECAEALSAAETAYGEARRSGTPAL